MGRLIGLFSCSIIDAMTNQQVLRRCTDGPIMRSRLGLYAGTRPRVRLFVQPLDPAYLRILLRTVPGKSVYVSEKRESSTSTLSAHQRRTNGEHRISRQIELSLAERTQSHVKGRLGLSFLERHIPFVSPNSGHVFAYILQPSDPAYLT